MKRATIKHWQKKIFILCWTSYACAYLCRLNISVAIPVLEENRVLAKTALGMAGGLFFWFYAFGQLINGRLGDRFDGRKFIFLGLLQQLPIFCLVSARDFLLCLFYGH